ncbi:hypothetical protein SAMN05192550_3333, partial [Flavobacterium glycines]
YFFYLNMSMNGYLWIRGFVYSIKRLNKEQNQQFCGE